MRLLFVQLLIFAVLSTSALGAEEPLERGVKGAVEDVILVGADDWHASVAATPLAIWSEDNQTVVKPLLILPRNVDAGERNGWLEQSDLERYGVSSVLHTFKSANITAITVHGKGDLVSALVEEAHKEGMKAYVTATLEIPRLAQPQAEEIKLVSDAKMMLLQEAGLQTPKPDDSQIDKSWLQMSSAGENGRADYFCPANAEVRDYLYKQVETLIDDYKADGVVLYKFGFQDENYCFCNACKERFYQDTGIDLSRVNSSSYNLERWNQWKQQQIMEVVDEARNITSDLGPVKLGVALGNPFDRSQGYNFAEICKEADFTIISPVEPADARLAVGMSKKPVYIRLNDDYVAYVLSTQNVEGAVEYIENLTRSGVKGLAFEYNVVYTQLWSELQPPSASAQWLLQQLGGKTLAIGNVSWKSDAKVEANNSFELAAKLSLHWKSSPGAVIVGENYSAALAAAPIASYLNWPMLFVGDKLPNETAAALSRLNAKEVAVAGQVSERVRQNLSQMNLTLLEANSKLLLDAMKRQNESPSMLVMTNSHDLSLLPLVPKKEIKRTLIKDLLAKIEISPSQIPAERLGEIVRLNVTLTNSDSDAMRGVRMVDIFPNGKLVRGLRPTEGEVNVTDPYSGQPSDALNSFLNGSLLRWELDRLEPGKSASLNLEVEFMYPMDSGWKQLLDSGATAAYEGYSYNHTVANRDSWPIINITYPAWIYSGRTNISWNLDRTSSYTALNLYSPDGRSGNLRITDIAPDKLYELRVPLLSPGKWKFNVEAGDGYTYRTENYTIDVRSNIQPMNITAVSHSKVPRLSLVAAQAAAAHKALLVDVAKDPQEIDPLQEEEALSEKVADWQLSPQYLMVVGDPGSMPFIPTGLRQKISTIMEYQVYRDYHLPLDEDNYTDVAVGRIMGLSVYDASQLMARTLAYDHLNGAWKNSSVVISSPPLEFPQAPIAMSIRDYLLEAGLKVKDLRYEEATYQAVSSQMNNGQNIVHFDHHGNEDSWVLSYWSMMDYALTGAHVKELTLSPQTTTAAACVTANLKGYYLNVSGTQMYVPNRLEDSIALAFIRAGAVNYVGESALSWIFVSDDYFKRFYQALIFENASVGQAQAAADNLYKLKFKSAEKIKNITDYEEVLPGWDNSVQTMFNQTAYMDVILGDPSFRPALPKVPPLPYTTEVTPVNTTGSENKTILKALVTPQNESATDWIYWVQTDTNEGKLTLNAPPAIIANVLLPRDADKIVVKEDGQAVWHDEQLMGEKKLVMWPIIRPRLGEERSFQVEYALIPGQVQRINLTAGWNALSIYLQPRDPSTSKHLKNKPYRGIFTATGDDWNFAMKDAAMSNVTKLEPGEGYLLDSAGNFSLEISGKPVDMPFRLNLHSGWNMIGLPMNRTVDLGNITVNAEHKRYMYPEAVEKGIVSAFIWRYDGNGWIHLGENETLQPGQAYLVEAMSESRLEFRE